MITREMILKGKNYQEEMNVEEYGATFLIRPLTDGESSEVQQIIMKNLPMEMVVKLQSAGSEEDKIKAVSDMENTAGIADFLKSNTDSNYLICAYGIVDNTGKSMFTIDDVKGFKIGVPAKIAQRIKEISGMEEAKEDSTGKVAEFRKE